VEKGDAGAGAGVSEWAMNLCRLRLFVFFESKRRGLVFSVVNNYDNVGKTYEVDR
jgi:hypothetical protein